MQVSPFRYLRIDVYLPLPAAFRSLSRLSSALSAKASTLRSYSLYLHVLRSFLRFVFKMHSVASLVSFSVYLNSTLRITFGLFSDVSIFCIRN